MIEDGVIVSQRLEDSRWISCGMLVVGCSSTYLLKPVNFPKSNFQSGLDFVFFNSPKVPLNCSKIVQLPIFYLVNYYDRKWKINLPIAQNSPNSPKNLPISNPVANCGSIDPSTIQTGTWEAIARAFRNQSLTWENANCSVGRISTRRER
jgi:hypothetical protein